MKNSIFNRSKTFLFGLIFSAFILAPLAQVQAIIIPTFTLGGNAHFDKVWQLSGSSYIDWTSDAADTDGPDVALGGISLSHTFYFGMKSPFDAVYFDMEVWGQLGTVSYAYSKPETLLDPGSFKSLTLTSNPSNDFKTSNLTGHTQIKFTPPSNWAQKEVNGVTAYWIKITTSSPYSDYVFANEVKARAYNLKLKFEDRQTNPWLENLPVASVQPSGAYLGEWNAGSGIHYYALPTDGGMYTLKITTPAGYVQQSIETLPLTTALRDHSMNPITIIPAVAVRVKDDADNHIFDASVTYQGVAPKEISGSWYYFANPIPGNHQLIVSREGYVTANGTSADGNTALLGVGNATGTSATVVEMTKVGAPCNQASLPAGQTSYCNALLRDFMLIVKDMNNNPIANASYTVCKDAGCLQTADDLAKTGQTADATGTTGQDGYGRAALASGNYYFKISAAGYLGSNVGPFVLTSGISNGYIVKLNLEVQPEDNVVSASKSAVSVSPASVSADNIKTSTVTVIARNASSIVLSGKAVTLSSSLAGATISPSSATTDAGGTATFTIKSSTQGSAVLTAVAGGVTLDTKPTVSFTASLPADTTVSASKSSVGASPSSIYADNLKSSTVTIIARNASSEVLSGKTVTLSSSLIGVVISPAQATTDANGTATFTVKSSAQGSTTLTAVAGGVTIDSKPTLTFTAPLQSQCQSPVVSVGSLVKLPDDGNLNTQDDSAVYYYGTDCKRHAFSNSKVYFTWYTDFSQVTEVQSGTLASMPLGKNVTYRPGVRMVKFTTDPKVYAVSKGGVLRWVKTEAVAIGLYGATWNKQIDDISDAFYINYTFGSEIADASGYNKQAELNNSLVVDDSL
jgi:hypothetical protein